MKRNEWECFATRAISQAVRPIRHARMNFPTRILCLILSGILIQSTSHAGQADGKGKELIVENKPLSYWPKMIAGRAMNMRMIGVSVLIGYVPEEHKPKVIPMLKPYLKTKRSTDAWMAAMVLGEYGSLARPLIPDLLKVLKAPQRDSKKFCNLHARVATTLGKILADANSSPEVDQVVKALIKKFSDGNIQTREASVRACGSIGPAAKACVPHLAGLFKKSGKSYMSSFPFWDGVAWTCGRMGKAASSCVPALLPVLLQTESPEAIEALGAIGEASKGVVPAILAAIQKVDGKKVMIKKGGRKDPMSGAARRAFILEAFNALAAFGPDSVEAVPLLKGFIERTTNAEKDQTLAALKALGAIGKKASSAKVSVGKLASKSSDADIQKCAKAALAEIQ